MNEPRILNPNGGWCWFQDERAIVRGDQLFFGSVASPSGDVNVTSVDLKSGDARTTTLYDDLASKSKVAAVRGSLFGRARPDSIPPGVSH